MITEKFEAALNDLGSLAGNVPGDVWERLSPIHAQLRGIQEPLANMESLGVMPGLEDVEEVYITCPEDGPHPNEPVSLSMCLVCDNLQDCWRE